MITIRRLIAILLLCMLAMPAFASELPPWEYPLAPEILEDKLDYLTLTSRSVLLDKEYEPGDLVKITVKRVVQDDLRKEAHDALTQMFNDALAAGYTLYVKSGYRSYQTQNTMYNSRLQKVGKDDGVVAYPGSSDHQTGLGVDILNYEWTQKDGMTPAFSQTAEAKWMAAHCQEYGFVIRYMEDKQDITGIIYEPWHLRYVGKAAACYMMENNLSLEEFTQDWQAYIANYEAEGGDFAKLLADRAKPNAAIVVDVSEDGEEELSVFY